MMKERTVFTQIDKALGGEFGPDQQRIAEVGISWIGTLLNKNTDYGGSVWERPVLCPDVSEDAAIRCRMSDKVKRLANLFSRSLDGKFRGPAVGDESIEDTIGDLGAYCLLWLARPRGRRPKMDNPVFDCGAPSAPAWKSKPLASTPGELEQLKARAIADAQNPANWKPPAQAAAEAKGGEA